MDPNPSRRRLIAGLGAASLAAGAHVQGSPAPTADRKDPASEYLLPPGMIHLNTASLGATPRVVLERTLEAWRMLESSPVRMAYGAQDDTVVTACESVRARAAALLNCDADELLITRCTTDGMNTVAQGINWRAGDRILTTDQEHHGGHLCWDYQARRRGVAIDRIAIAPEEHDTAAIVRRFADALRPGTRAISVSHVITSTGLRMPVAAIGKLAHARGALCIVDGAQAAGAIRVDVHALGCDAYATSGHKWLMGPKGTGLLYVRRSASDAIAPIQWQEARTFRANSAGVGPLPLVIGLGAAIDRLQAIGMADVEKRNLALRARAYEGLSRIAAVKVVGPPAGGDAAPMVACRLPDALDSRAVMDGLREKHGIIVKMVEKQWFNGLRVSPHVLNTADDIDRMLEALRELLA